MSCLQSAPSGFRTLCFTAAFSTALLGGLPASATAQEAAVPAATPSPNAPHQTGTVKEVHLHDFLLTTPAGEFAVSVPEGSHILLVTPDVKKLSDAPPGSMKDIQPGDRASVVGTVGDAAPALTATRVLVMKSATVNAAHAADSAAWSQGVGGIVKSVSGSAITLSSGLKTISVQTTSTTSVKRYAPGSVKFDDAVSSTVAAIQPGDQLRVRGAKSPDGSSITADAIVSGNFRNYSGTIASIDPGTQTITLKDLTTRKTVSVALTASSDVRRLPPQAAAMMAARLKGGTSAGAGTGGEEDSGNRTGGGDASRAGRPNGGQGGGPNGGQGGPGMGGGRAAGADLSRMLSRLPTETLGGLKQGDAVMIVATAAAPDAGDKATAITLLVGVDAILAAPAGQSTQLSPWSVGSEGEMASGMAGGGGPQ